MFMKTVKTLLSEKVSNNVYVLLKAFLLIVVVSLSHYSFAITYEKYCERMDNIMESLIESNAVKEVSQRKCCGPFTNAKLTNAIKVRDSDGEYNYFYTGSNPAYYYDRQSNKEYFFAGEMFEDNQLLCGNLKIFTPYGWSESVGSYEADGTHVVGFSVTHDYFTNQYPELAYKSKKYGNKYFDITDEAAMYRILEELRAFEFDDEDYPKSVKPLPANLSPRVLTKSYCVNLRNASRQSKPLVTSAKPKQMTTAGKLFTFATLLAAVGIAAKAISDDNSSSSSSASSEPPTSVYSKGNVEIVNWGTLGSLAISHAQVDLRNKNNYDVVVTIGLYQGSWSLGEIIYSDYEKSDYISGVSDRWSTSIRIKANSMRSVYLKAEHRGRPTAIRINSVQ